MKIITLPAAPKDELNWDSFIQEADEKILWQLDFGWNTSPLNIWDPASFQSYLLAVEECIKHLQKRFPSKKHSLSFIHLKDSFFKYLIFNERLETRYEEFLASRKNNPLLLELFCANLFSEYLHRLASVLPNEYNSLIVVESSPFLNKAFLAQLFCPRRFAHFKQIHFIKKIVPKSSQPVIGLVLPPDDVVNGDIFNQLETVVNILEENKQKFSFIPEELLNESWEGIEYLILSKSTLSSQGMRMLYGFIAAEGHIITIDEKIGCENEISLEEFYRKKLGIKY